MKAFKIASAGPRKELKADVQGCIEDSQKVDDMFAAAWNMQIENTVFVPASEIQAPRIFLKNQDGVSDAYRTAAQADQNLGKEVITDAMKFKTANCDAACALKKDI